MTDRLDRQRTHQRRDVGSAQPRKSAFGQRGGLRGMKPVRAAVSTTPSESPMDMYAITQSADVLESLRAAGQKERIVREASTPVLLVRGDRPKRRAAKKRG
jgi:hypothetical protein